MAAACAPAPTGMSAVLGGDPDEVWPRIEALGLTPANRNGAGQIVAAGATERAGRRSPTTRPARARVRPLTVAGAFHTPYMGPAEESLGAVAAGVEPARPGADCCCPTPTAPRCATGDEVLDRLVRQVTRPVRWDLCQATLRDLGVTALIELPPAGTLAGIARRELPGVETVALKTPDDLAAARPWSPTCTAAQAEHTPDWRVVIAPAGGTFAAGGIAEGTRVRAGSQLGAVRTKKEDLQVSAGYDGVLVEWLLQDGDLVDPGEPLARLVPGTAEEHA